MWPKIWHKPYRLDTRCKPSLHIFEMRCIKQYEIKWKNIHTLCQCKNKFHCTCMNPKKIRKSGICVGGLLLFPGPMQQSKVCLQNKATSLQLSYFNPYYGIWYIGVRWLSIECIWGRGL